MKSKIRIISFLFLSFLSVGHTQSSSTIQDINAVWDSFTTAYNTLDYNLMQKIHTEDMVRISGGSRIMGKTQYMEGYQSQFERAKEQEISYDLQLRFFERLHDDSRASERGIYQLARTSNGETNTYYGQFHVILVKINDTWKIRMDYDSSEGNTIGEAQFLAAKTTIEWE